MRFLASLVPMELVAALILAVTDHADPVPVLMLAALLPMAMGAAMVVVRAS